MSVFLGPAPPRPQTLPWLSFARGFVWTHTNNNYYITYQKFFTSLINTIFHISNFSLVITNISLHPQANRGKQQFIQFKNEISSRNLETKRSNLGSYFLLSLVSPFQQHHPFTSLPRLGGAVFQLSLNWKGIMFCVGSDGQCCEIRWYVMAPF